MPPVEPEPSLWLLPDPSGAQGDLVAVGADLAPGTVLSAYRRGLFPMDVEPGGPLGWWSPDPRGVIGLDQVRVSRSLRASVRRFTVTVDRCFDEVVAACGDPGRPHGWITPAIRRAYGELHRLGWAHSVEVWTPEGEFAGGLYGVQIGGLFAGESMVHRRRDASKVALVALVELLGGADGAREGRVLDVQWLTPHLASLGGVAIARREYLRRLGRALTLPPALPS